ncbi:JNK1/MAPK8-associated membrane protein, partial [Trichinella pseudospiralis]
LKLYEEMAFPPRFGMPSIAQTTFVPTYNAVPVVLPTTAHYLMPTLANSGVVRNVVQKTPPPAPLTKRQEILMEKPPVTTVFVGNINEQATNEMIKAMLVKCGNIISWKRIQGPNGKFQAFGFCEYDHPDSTLRALRLLHDWPLGDKKLVLKCDEKNKCMLIDFINKRRSLYNKPPLKMEGDQLPADDEIRKEDEMFRKALKNLVKEMAPELFEGTSKSHVPKSPTLTGKGGNLDIESLDRDRKEYIAKEIIQFREAHKDDKEARLKGKSVSVDVNEKNERFIERQSSPLETDRRASTKFERNCAPDSADAKVGEAKGRRRGSSPETGSRRRRSPSADRLLESNEDAREREKLERKAREKEKNYLERLEKLEAREKRKAKERLKQAEKEKRRKKEQVLADIKIMQEFLEDYIDEEGDLEFYQGKSLLLRKDAITNEMEWDALDRLREAEEIALIRRKLIEENSTKDSNETKIIIEEIPLNPVKLEERQHIFSECETDKADNNDVTDEVDSAVTKVKKETVLIPTVFLPAQAENSQPIGFAGLKLGSVSTSTNTAAPIPLQQMFNEPDEEFSVVKTSSRKLVPLEYTEEEKRVLEMPNMHTQMSAEERKKYVKSLIDKIPSSKEELFKYEIHWEYVDQLLIDRRIKPWISKKIIEYIGEEEASLVDFISEKVLDRSTPQGLLDDISMVLDEEAGVFVAKLWRLLIYEIEAKRVDFYYDVLFELTVFPDSAKATSGMIMLIVRCYSHENLLTYSFPKSTILIYRPWPWRWIRMFLKLPLFVVGYCNDEQTFMMDNFLFDNPEPCPGLYCGRQVIADGNYTECGVNVYDWLYLGFMGFLPFLLHCASIKFTSAQTRDVRNVVLPQIAAAFVECIFPAILSLLIVEPKGSLNFYTCGVQKLQDWYPVFYNPVIDYTKTVHCTQEAVYPLYFLPFVYYLFSLLSLSIVHPIVICAFKLKKEGASGAIYAALYFYPVLIILHSVLCGLIYYAFPYIILFAAICLNAMHLALYETQTPICILNDMWRKKQNLAVLCVLIYLYLYGILSISRFSSYWVYNVMFLFIPAPSIFYVLTVKFTHPHRLNMII